MSEDELAEKGLVCGPCPRCGAYVDEGEYECSSCGYSRQFDPMAYEFLVYGNHDDWKEFKEENPIPRLEGANLRDVDLSGRCLSYAVMRGCDLRGRDIKSRSKTLGTKFRYTQLQGSNFHGRNLREADFEGAVLYGIDFSHANLCGTNFLMARVNEGTMFRYCDMDPHTNFEGVNLDMAVTSDEFRGEMYRMLTEKTKLGWGDD